MDPLSDEDVKYKLHKLRCSRVEGSRTGHGTAPQESPTSSTTIAVCRALRTNKSNLPANNWAGTLPVKRLRAAQSTAGELQGYAPGRYAEQGSLEVLDKETMFHRSH